MPLVLHYLPVDMRRRRHWFRNRISQMVFVAGRWLCCLMAILAGTAASQAQSTDDIEIELDQFGVMSHYRPGDLTGIRLIVTNNPAGSLGEAVAARVQIELPNADGDVVEYGRAVTLTRGRPTPVWIYLPIPPDFSHEALLRVRVFEVRDGRRQREIGGGRIGPRQTAVQRVPVTASMIAVIGQRRMGLQDYAVAWDQFDRSPSAHEPTRIVSITRPELLPDSWEALSGFEAIAWSDALPRDLTTDAAAGIREYVRRGGHLVINLPEDTNPWQFGVAGQHPLEDMLPRTEPRKDEAVSLRDLVPVLSKAQSTDIEREYGIRVFKEVRGEFDVIDNHYEPLIAMPDGRVVVVRRTFGHGWVTVIGIDLAQQTLYTMPLSNGSRGMPQADAFWNRILGRRIDTPTTSELQAIRDHELLVRSTPNENSLEGGRLFYHYVSMTTQAGRGLMVALLLFAAYWLLAGPGGFGILKVYKKVRHAWLMFAAVAIAFTAVAYVSVQAIRMSGNLDEPQVRHISYLDHIARPGMDDRPEDPQLQRAVSWLSLYTPGYGQTPVRIDSMAGQRDILSSWTPPQPVIMQPFPNVDRYQVDVRSSPASHAIPSRSTATQMYANWMGGLERTFGMMVRPRIENPIEVIIRQEHNRRREHGLRGVLTHDLPGMLRDVTIIWVTNDRNDRRYAVEDDSERRWVRQLDSGRVLNRAYMERATPWAPGDPLDLSILEFRPGETELGENIKRRYVDEYRVTGLRGPGPIREANRRHFLEMLSFFHQITPPQYLKSRRTADEPTDEIVFQRVMAREVDLSTWFTRPCLIIIGYLENSDLPVPLRVNDADSTPMGEGMTLVRWIHPLPIEEDIAFPPPLEDDV